MEAGQLHRYVIGCRSEGQVSLGRCGTWTLSVSKRAEGSSQQVPGASLKGGGERAKQVRVGADTLLSFVLGSLGYQSGKGAIAPVESGGSLLRIQSCDCYYRQSYFILRLLKV